MKGWIEEDFELTKTCCQKYSFGTIILILKLLSNHFFQKDSS